MLWLVGVLKRKSSSRKGCFFFVSLYFASLGEYRSPVRCCSWIRKGDGRAVKRANSKRWNTCKRNFEWQGRALLQVTAACMNAYQCCAPAWICWCQELLVHVCNRLQKGACSSAVSRQRRACSPAPGALHRGTCALWLVANSEAAARGGMLYRACNSAFLEWNTVTPCRLAWKCRDLPFLFFFF